MEHILQKVGEDVLPGVSSTNPCSTEINMSFLSCQKCFVRICHMKYLSLFVCSCVYFKIDISFSCSR